MEKEELTIENTEKITDKRLLNLKEPWKAGDPSPNPEGRPKGQRNYATIYREALIKLATLNGKTAEELENELIASGFAQAKKDYRFYKDVLDRIHGTAIARTDITSKGDKIVIDDEKRLLALKYEEELKNKM